MRKWLVPNHEKPGTVKIKASYDCPPDTVCEVPDHFTRAMEPFISLKEVKLDNGGTRVEPVLDPAFFKKEVEAREKGLQESFERNKKLLEAQNKLVAREKFNSMNPVQRFFKNIFGDYADEAQFFLFKQLFQVIFKKEIK